MYEVAKVHTHATLSQRPHTLAARAAHGSFYVSFSSSTHALAASRRPYSSYVERERVLRLVVVNLVEDEEVGGRPLLDGATL